MSKLSSKKHPNQFFQTHTSCYIPNLSSSVIIYHPDPNKNKYYDGILRIFTGSRMSAFAELALFEPNQVSMKDEYVAIEHDHEFAGCHDIYHLPPQLLYSKMKVIIFSLDF